MRYDWFKWYPARYKAKTIDFTPAQDGIYRRLIDYYMETGVPLPLKMTGLARIAGVSIQEMAEAFEVIRPLMEETPEGYRDNLCDEQLAAQETLHRGQVQGGKTAQKLKAEQKAKDEPQLNLEVVLEVEPEANPEQNRIEKNREESKNPPTPLTDEAPNVPETVPTTKTAKPDRKSLLIDWLKSNGPADGSLPPDWVDWAEGKHGWDLDTIGHIAQQFHRYFTGPDAKEPRKIDWKRAFQTWCDRAINEAAAFVRSKKGANGSQKAGYSGAVASSSEKAKAMLEVQSGEPSDDIPDF